MREVRVHLDDELRSAFQSAGEAGEIRLAEPALGRTVQHLDRSALLGEPIAEYFIEFSCAGYEIAQHQVFYSVLVESSEVTLDVLDDWERATTDKYGWLSADDLESGEPAAHPEIPALIRAAVAAVRGRSV